jgi:hypothetical protein
MSASVQWVGTRTERTPSAYVRFRLPIVPMQGSSSRDPLGVGVAACAVGDAPTGQPVTVRDFDGVDPGRVERRGALRRKLMADVCIAIAQ